MSLTQLDQFFPFDQGAGLNATMPRWRLMARLWYGSGVVPGYLNQFNATLAGGVLTIQPGGAWIDGFYGEANGNKTLAVSNGLVVARMDPTGRQIIFAFVPGVAPLPAPVQNLNDIYEIPLWRISGTTLTDARQFANAVPGKAAGGRIYRAATYTTSTSWLDFGFDSPTPRPPGFSGAVFTCPYAADYLVMAQIGFGASAINQYYNIAILRNGTNMCQADVGNTFAGGSWTVNARDILFGCKTGDQIKIQHICSTAGLNGWVGSQIAYFSVRALS